MEFYIAVDGKQEGPYAEEEVRQRLANRQVQPTDHCWTDGWVEWRLLQEAFAEECRALEPPPLASWATLVSQPADEAEALRRRLPIRRDRTSAGIFAVVGVLSVVLILIGIGWLLGSRGGREGVTPPSGSPARQNEVAGVAGLREMHFSGSNLEQIAQACLVYAKANGGNLPAYSAQLRPLFGSRFADVMDVPETPERESSGYVVRMGLHLSMPGETPIAFEAGTRPDGTRGVAYLNGRVRVLPRGDPELQRALRR